MGHQLKLPQAEMLLGSPTYFGGVSPAEPSHSFM